MPRISCKQFRELIVGKEVCSLIYTSNNLSDHLLSMRAIRGLVTEVIRRGDSQTYYVAQHGENGNVALMEGRRLAHEILLSRPYGIKRDAYAYHYAGMTVFRLSSHFVDAEPTHTYYIVKENDYDHVV